MAKTELGKYFTPRIIINLSIIVGFLIMVIWLLISLASEMESKAESIQSQKVEISARIQAISDLADLRTDAERAKPIVEELNNTLPKRDELVAFPRYLDSLAKDNSLQLAFKFIGTTQDPVGDQAGNSEFLIDILGGYANVLKFIEAVENGRFIVTLESFNIALEKTGFDVGLKGKIYFRG